MNAMDCKTAFATDETLIDTIHPATGLSWCFGKTLEIVQQEYPTAKVVNIDEWCKAKGERQNTPIEWEEVTEARFYDMLNVLPPAAMVPGAFLVGEPTDHHAGNGRPRFQAFKAENGIERTPEAVKFFASSRPITHAEFCTLFGKTPFTYI